MRHPTTRQLAALGVASQKVETERRPAVWRVRCSRVTKYGLLPYNNVESLADAMFEVFESAEDARAVAKKLQDGADDLVRDYGLEEWRVEYGVEVVR